MMNQVIRISLASQRLQLLNNGSVVMDVQVATAKNGAGELFGSECTPRGRHKVRAMIGDGGALNTVFVARRPTGEIFSEKLRIQQPQRDWILTRILWLSGEEVGKNRLGNMDTMRRYIYIHGSPDDQVCGVANSHGCIRMKNQEVMTLFSGIKVGTSVLILEKEF